MMDTNKHLQRFFPNPWLGNSISNLPKLNNINYLEEAKRLSSICKDYYTKDIISHIDNENHSTGTYSFGSLYCGSLGTIVYLPLRILMQYKLLKGTDVDDVDDDDTNTRKYYLSQQHELLIKRLACLDQQTTRKNRFTLIESEEIGIICMIIAIQNVLKSCDANEREHNTLFCTLSQRLLDCHDIMEKRLSTTECEVLYGRAGYLQAIAYIRQCLKDEKSASASHSTTYMNHPSSSLFGKDVAIRVIESILEQGQKVSKKYKGVLTLMWEWHEKVYLGSAHGIVGILHVLLHFVPEVSELSLLHQNQRKNQNSSSIAGINSMDYLQLIETTICELSDKMCFPCSGNLASSYDQYYELQGKSDKLVHWCHGATGYVLLLVKAYEVFDKDKYLTKAKQVAEDVIWKRGLLKKGVGLCHGISGNAYAFLAVYHGIRMYHLRHNNSYSNDESHAKKQKKEKQVDGMSPGCVDDKDEEMKWLHMAQCFASFALENLSELEHQPDRPYSLFEGLGGLAILLLDLQMTHHAKFPLYDI